MNTRKRNGKDTTEVELAQSFLTTDSARFGYLEERAIALAAIRLAELLEDAGWTQRDLGERMGVSNARVSQILSAEENVTLRTLARAGAALGCAVDIEFRPEGVACAPRRHLSIVPHAALRYEERQSAKTGTDGEPYAA